MPLSDALRATATDEIEVCGIGWRVRKVTSADLMRVQVATLALLPVDTAAAIARAAGEAPESPPPMDEREMVKALVNAQEANVNRLNALRRGLVAAGTTHGREPGGEWEPVTISLDDDPPSGQIAIRDLPPGTEEAIAAAVMRLSSDGGQAIARLESFRRAAG